MDDHDYVDIHPWPVPELAGQLVAHVALGRRGLIEADHDGDVFERETDRFELEAWARLELTTWLTELQSAVLALRIGNLGDEHGDLCADSLVVASTIAWAIGIVDSPALAFPGDGEPEQRALEWAPGPWTNVRSVVKGVRVRPDEELAAERERWELLYWRTTLFDDPAMAEEDRRALREAIEEVRGQPGFTIVDDDLALDDGTSFGALAPDDLAAVSVLAETRLRTLNWVCGFGESPASAPLYLED